MVEGTVLQVKIGKGRRKRVQWIVEFSFDCEVCEGVRKSLNFFVEYTPDFISYFIIIWLASNGQVSEKRR